MIRARRLFNSLIKLKIDFELKTGPEEEEAEPHSQEGGDLWKPSQEWVCLEHSA